MEKNKNEIQLFVKAYILRLKLDYDVQNLNNVSSTNTLWCLEWFGIDQMLWDLMYAKYLLINSIETKMSSYDTHFVL